MKVLLINGSPNEKGCTYTALMEVAATLQQEGIDWQLVQLGKKPVQDCVACKQCKKHPGRCAIEGDMVNELIAMAREADGFVFGTPVYFSHPNGRILSILNRVFYAGESAFYHKPGAAVVSARRGGNSSSFDVLNKYFTITGMPVVSSNYWNMVHGYTPEDVKQDREGMQTMRNIGRNMAWLLKCIEAGKQQGITAPTMECTEQTNFIDY